MFNGNNPPSMALQLHPNESVWVKNGFGTKKYNSGGGSIYNGVYSTFTIVKVK